MKATFNATCDRCLTFRTRCALAFVRVAGKATEHERTPTTLCTEYRKALHGRYRLDARHRHAD